MERDPVVERLLLDQIGAPPEFLEEVLGRLRGTEEQSGNDGWERPVDELLAEVLEEAADVVGWGVGVAYQLDEPERQRLLVALRLAAGAWREVVDLIELVAARG